MRRLRTLWIMLVLVLAWTVPAWADGQQYSGACATISWTQNVESDLAGYRLYDRVSLSSTPTLRATYGPQVTSVTCASLGFNAGQHYISLTAFDTSGNESAHTAEIPFVIVLNNQVTDLRVTIINATDMTLTFTEVDNGLGAPATYDVRFATSSINWGTAASVTSGTCTTPVAGTTIGASKSCTVTGLSTTTAYQFQLVPYRGTLGTGSVVYGPLSNIASGTTGGSPPAGTGRLTYASDSFNRANNASLGTPWSHISNFNAQIISNAVQAGAINRFVREVYADTTVLPADQWAEVTLTANAGAQELFQGVMLRASRTENTQYECGATRNDIYNSIIEKYVGGIWTVLAGETATTWNASDVLRCEVIGQNLGLYRNDVLILSATDTEIISGDAGLVQYLVSGGTSSNMILDNWSAGTFLTSSETCGCDNH